MCYFWEKIRSVTTRIVCLLVGFCLTGFMLAGCGASTASSASSLASSSGSSSGSSAVSAASDTPLLTRENFDYVRYADTYPDLMDAFGYDADALWEHLVSFGVAELREYHSTDPEVEAVITGFDGAAKLRLRAAITGEETGAPDEASGEEAVSLFYAGTLCAGDSMMAGFHYYCAASDDPMLQSFLFLANPGYSVELALQDWEGGYHPPFRAKKVPLWESVPQTGAKTLILYLGTMDLSEGREPVEIAENYELLLQRIVDATGDLRIILLSVLYPYDAESRTVLHTGRVDALNYELSEMASRNGYVFLDVTGPLSDGNGSLLPEYSLDEQTHITPEGYDVWIRVLSEYALSQH